MLGPLDLIFGYFIHFTAVLIKQIKSERESKGDHKFLSNMYTFQVD